jgi:hypothetical protein
MGTTKALLASLGMRVSGPAKVTAPPPPAGLETIPLIAETEKGEEERDEGAAAERPALTMPVISVGGSAGPLGMAFTAANVVANSVIAANDIAAEREAAEAQAETAAAPEEEAGIAKGETKVETAGRKGLRDTLLRGLRGAKSAIDKEMKKFTGKKPYRQMLEDSIDRERARADKTEAALKEQLRKTAKERGAQYFAGEQRKKRRQEKKAVARYLKSIRDRAHLIGEMKKYYEESKKFYDGRFKLDFDIGAATGLTSQVDSDYQTNMLGLSANDEVVNEAFGLAEMIIKGAKIPPQAYPALALDIWYRLTTAEHVKDIDQRGGGGAILPRAFHIKVWKNDGNKLLTEVEYDKDGNLRYRKVDEENWSETFAAGPAKPTNIPGHLVRWFRLLKGDDLDVYKFAEKQLMFMLMAIRDTDPDSKVAYYTIESLPGEDERLSQIQAGCIYTYRYTTDASGRRVKETDSEGRYLLDRKVVYTVRMYDEEVKEFLKKHDAWLNPGEIYIVPTGRDLAELTKKEIAMRQHTGAILTDTTSRRTRLTKDIPTLIEARVPLSRNNVFTRRPKDGSFVMTKAALTAKGEIMDMTLPAIDIMHQAYFHKNIICAVEVDENDIRVTELDGEMATDTLRIDRTEREANVPKMVDGKLTYETVTRYTYTIKAIIGGEEKEILFMPGVKKVTFRTKKQGDIAVAFALDGTIGALSFKGKSIEGDELAAWDGEELLGKKGILMWRGVRDSIDLKIRHVFAETKREAVKDIQAVIYAPNSTYLWSTDRELRDIANNPLILTDDTGKVINVQPIRSIKEIDGLGKVFRYPGIGKVYLKPGTLITYDYPGDPIMGIEIVKEDGKEVEKKVVLPAVSGRGRFRWGIRARPTRSSIRP